jgi:tRNA threonylcarbamoyladenosine biosynthesis protein TsaE
VPRDGTPGVQGPPLSELTEPELQAWGEEIGRTALPPLFLALRGDLGAGKTTLARAIARGAGLDGPIPSPTYNLLFRYATPRGPTLVHLDLYRLAHPDEVWDLGWSEFPADDELVLVEWPERAEALLPTPRWEIVLDGGAAADRRGVSLHAFGDPGALPPLPEVAG